MSLPSGILVIGGIEEIDQRWQHGVEGTGTYVVDISGPHAEAIATRVGGANKREHLPDGVWRVHAEGPRQAGLIQDDSRNYCLSNAWTDQVTCVNITSTVNKVKDSLRGTNVGETGPYVAVRSTGNVVIVNGPDGKTPKYLKIELA